MKKKNSEIALEYPYEKLEKILKDATAKANTGKLTLEDKLYGIAAGYAQDFVDTSRAVKKPLDLTGRTEDNIFYTLMAVCTANQAQKKTTAENRTDMAKKLGSYQLFSIVNSMNCETKCVEIVTDQGVMIRDPKLVIRSLPDKDGKTYTFDPLAAAKETIDQMTILDPKQNNGAVLFGQLTPFYQKLRTDLMDHINEE